jgi:EAL domain-containing protein (putative c-di-GMP-specific phosphodiesterase class I)
VAGALAVTSVAEGVETGGQLALLSALGCEAVQGNLLSPPLTATQISLWIAGVSAAPAEIAPQHLEAEAARA